MLGIPSPPANQKNVHKQIRSSLNHCCKTSHNPLQSRTCMFFQLPLACQSSKTIPFCFTQNSVSDILLWCRGTDARLSFSKDSLACLKLWCSGQEEGAGRMGTDYHRRTGLDGWRDAWGAQDMRPLPPSKVPPWDTADLEPEASEK